MVMGCLENSSSYVEYELKYEESDPWADPPPEVDPLRRWTTLSGGDNNTEGSNGVVILCWNDRGKNWCSGGVVSQVSDRDCDMRNAVVKPLENTIKPPFDAFICIICTNIYIYVIYKQWISLMNLPLNKTLQLN